MPKVSVIIPVFGVEKYIERCARSLFDQTLDDIEYIFVNDDTPDKSIEILKKVIGEYPLRIEQTRIVNMPSNTGQAGVRRTGIRLATGDYVIHCDSDDWIDTDMYRAMYLKAVDEDSDVVVCDYIVTDGTDDQIYSGLLSTAKEQTIVDMLCHGVSWSLSNKLYRRTLYSKDITYPQGNMGEDMAFTMQLIYYCDKISYVEKAFYYYYKNPQSITNSVLPERVWRNFTQACMNVKIVDNFYKKNFLNSKIALGLVRLKFSQRNILYPILKDRKYFKDWVETFPEINLRALFCYEITIKEKIKFLLVFLRLYPR